MTGKILKRTICPLDCPDSCAMLATVVDDKVVRLEGDRDHPYTRGFICRKMRKYPERMYGRDRLRHPLLRTGDKGAGKFSRISWDEALDLVAERLGEVRGKYGGEAILPYSYAGNMGAVNRFAGFPLFHKLGASRLDQTICSAAAGAGWKYQCGSLCGSPPENCAAADLIVAWGINIRVSNVHFWQYVTEARKKGGRLVVIDPYRGHTAKLADLHLAVQPGGDSGLALGLAKCIIENGLKEDSPASGCSGYGEWRQYLLGLDWSTIVGQSGVTKADICSLAGELAAHDRTFFRIGIGLSRNSRGGMSVRAIAALGALLGLFDGGEGRGILLSSGAFKGDGSRLTYPGLAPAETRLVNMIHLGHALTGLRPPVKALFVYNANPLSVSPDSSRVRRGLEREDLFTVVHEQVMTPTARYADVVLPATTFLENLDIYTAYGHFYAGVARPAVEPFGEARSNFDLFQQLARRMGFDDPPFQQSCRERLVDYLQTLQGVPEEFDMDAFLQGDFLRSTSWQPQRSGAEWREIFHFTDRGDCTTPAFPSLIPAAEFGDPDLLSRFHLKLITPPHPDLLNSTFGERFQDRAGEVLLNPADAQEAEVNDGERVVIENLRGQSVRVARVTKDAPKGIVVAEGIFWGDFKQAPAAAVPAGINELTSQKTADMGGGATFHESLVRLRRFP
jgi:anaerobic selenocysteine-containing dehydrogenase